VTTEGEKVVMKNLKRKAEAADRMFSSLVAEMNQAVKLDRHTNFTEMETVPAWL
jgi:hypothetical protein